MTNHPGDDHDHDDEKDRTAAHVLRYRVHPAQARADHADEKVFDTRAAAEEELHRLRQRGIDAVVTAVHRPLPSDPWLDVQR